jgi:catechol-2,3-dioxygenase
MPSSTTNEKPTVVRGLGEIALRLNNLDAMQEFYAHVIRLPLMTRFQNSAFFKIADGYGGHTQVLALFDRAQSPGYRGSDAATSTVDHIAFEIALTGRLANVFGPLGSVLVHSSWLRKHIRVHRNWLGLGRIHHRQLRRPLTKGRTLV